MNKFNFINTLIENEKFNDSQKERFLKLVTKEFGHASDFEKKVLSDLEEIKNKMNHPKLSEIKKGVVPTNEQILGSMGTGGEKVFKSEANTPIQNPKDVLALSDKFKWTPSYINSSGIYKYLFDYNNNSILKSTCHKIDSNELKTINEVCKTDTYDFNKHLDKIIEAFEIHDKKYAPAFIKSFIRLYLTGKDYYGNLIGSTAKAKDKTVLGWTEDTIVFSWTDQKLLKWAGSNMNIPPCPSEGLANNIQNLGYVFETPIKNSYQRNIPTFSKLIIHFKKMFHINSDNSLKEIIELQNKKNEWNDKVDFEITMEEFPKSIELFTYVDRITQAYNKLIELSIEKADEKPKIKLTLVEDENSVSFTINHLNSQYKKTQIGILDRLHGQTYQNLITNQINGLCELFVLADMGHETFLKFNVWDENYDKKRLKKTANPIKFEKLDNSIQGVAHVMRFKKK